MAIRKCAFLPSANICISRCKGNSGASSFLTSLNPTPLTVHQVAIRKNGNFGLEKFFRAVSISNMSENHVQHEQFSARNPVRTAVLVSGGGRSLANLCERISSRQLTNVNLCVVIASKKTAGAIALAEGFGLPVHVVREKDFAEDKSLFSDAITEILDSYSVHVVVLAGWMHFYRIPERYLGKVINIHPSLIPAFCGKGYYGNRVHAAVLEFGAKITGCTVHLADNEYDHGPIILQKAVEVLDSDTVEELAARVFEAEKEALPEAIQMFADSRLHIEGRIVKVWESARDTIDAVA